MEYEDLLQNKDRYEISYYDLLLTDEWLSRRKEILLRDKNTCTTCGNFKSVSFFNVHGKKNYQIFGKDTKVEITLPDGSKKEVIAPSFKISTKPLILHVHHRRYILGRLPWEYGGKDLITMCYECHMRFHEENDVEVYNENDNFLEKVNAITCPKCKGAGSFPQYVKIQNGICFTCKGTTYIVIDKNQKTT
ncbi:MAG: hypothetical protein K0S26_1409 [Bacteroidota bacterium]|jgi:5-methylcytosine-specific restriction endonuclease McrA|nr:hypothetical protein [Bacteroidota bacterium]